ncbi:hypothetical protein A0257_05965 [Hymenobacter psoromatis]|nr:hypothetical protein A0257_05965 [Hymenobacter psoromatis]
MKTRVLIWSLSLLLLMLLMPPAGHSAHYRQSYLAGARSRSSRLRLLPLRVVRTPAVAEQHRLVQTVGSDQGGAFLK